MQLEVEMKIFMKSSNHRGLSHIPETLVLGGGVGVGAVV